MEIHNTKSITDEHGGKPSLLSIEEKTDELEEELTSLSIDEAKYEAEAERLEKLSDIKHNDKKLLYYYSPIVLIPASIIGVGIAIANPSVAVSIAALSASTVAGAHSFKVINKDYPKITEGGKSSLFAAFKELKKKKREVLKSFLDMSNKLENVREQKKDKYEELDNLQEYRREVMKMIQEEAKAKAGVEEEPLFVQVVEEYKKEQNKVKKLV